MAGETKRYRRKPCEVEAIRWTGANREEAQAFVGELGTVAATTVSMWTGTALTGDFIVRTEEGTLVVYSPDRFEDIYEETPDAKG